MWLDTWQSNVAKGERKNLSLFIIINHIVKLGNVEISTLTLNSTCKRLLPSIAIVEKVFVLADTVGGTTQSTKRSVECRGITFCRLSTIYIPDAESDQCSTFYFHYFLHKFTGGGAEGCFCSKILSLDIWVAKCIDIFHYQYVQKNPFSLFWFSINDFYD